MRSREYIKPFLLAMMISIFPAGLSGSNGTPSRPPGPSSGNVKGDAGMTTITVTSTVISNGQPIPVKYTGDGEDISPPLKWSGEPGATREFVLICDDPDAPVTDPWVHWVVYNIPFTQRSMPEGKPGRSLPDFPPGMKEGKNSFGKTTYGGPSPPPGHGVHRYFFKIFALDSKIDLPAGATKNQVLTAMEGHILAKGELVGTYER